MSFKQVEVACESYIAEILIAELSMIGFDIFEELETGFLTAIPTEAFQQQELQEIFEKYQNTLVFTQKISTVEKLNWNEEWEKNYDPVRVGTDVLVRAIFHVSESGFTHEIVINPKMSFGTGHHATTSLMLTEQMNIDHDGKKVYDFGTGSGILAIMAEKLGATSIWANDVDDWCIENARENLSLNGSQAELFLGPVHQANLPFEADIILANINKNILLQELQYYVRNLVEGGSLLLSGFYESDTAELIVKAEELGMQHQKTSVKDAWCVLVFVKAEE
ncbi:MAG: ribosomal protein L11 methyltransferase [Paraglaciecola sp.]|jgi:ribosomal protein L11 methyltransferase